MLIAAALLAGQGGLALMFSARQAEGVLSAAGPTAAATAALGLLLCSGLLAGLARWSRAAWRWRAEALQLAWAVNLLASAAATALAAAPHCLALAALGTMVGVAGAALLAPMARLWLLATPLPLLQGVLAAIASGQWWWLWVGGLGSVAAAASGWDAHRAWSQRIKTFLQQADRIRSLQLECQIAQRADQDKGRLLGIASHDLRQPVHAIALFAATLQRRLQQSAEEPLARNLTRAVDGLERSFNSLLDLSRLDGGALVPKPQIFPLRDMFRRLHMQYAGQAELLGLGLRFSPGGKSVTSDPQLLERVVGNLVQNAIKYTERGGIVVVARSTRSHINVEVWDTGSGIAASELPRIFEEFYQIGHGDRDRTHGLGMGLAIVKRLVALMGHRLEVASVPGRGTMFRIGLPIGGLSGLQQDLAPADTLPMSVDADTPKVVLVVDDEEPIREGLRLLLHEWGFQVMTAANAALADAAVNALEGRVDLVLTDLHLGDGQDGQQVIANVRRVCGHDVPAILITGETMIDAVQRLTVSSDPVLFKPVQPRRLYEAMRAALGRGLL